MIEEAESLLKRLHTQGVEFVIIGGICNVLHGVTLVTQDVDVCCRFSPENRLDAAVRELHPVHRQTPQRLPFVLNDRLVQELKNIYARTRIHP
ncbi:MAG TPA: hypothetical protein VJS65_00190 [Verrucomicrobiae bacterium]|nr:hypothetical protein [Verrucomicrobiae bacterium]